MACRPPRVLMASLVSTLPFLAGALCDRPRELRPTAVDMPAGAASATPYDPHAATRFDAGDLFEIRLVGEPDLSGVYRVAPTGTFDFPYCGRVTVAGLLASEVATRISDCLVEGRYFKDPQIVVIARETGASRKVFVFGNVAKAGPYPFADRMTIVEAVALAGGFAPFAGQNQISVIRTDPEGREERFKVAVQDIGLGIAPNFLLRTGDIVFVPEAIF